MGIFFHATLICRRVSPTPSENMAAAVNYIDTQCASISSTTVQAVCRQFLMTSSQGPLQNRIQLTGITTMLLFEVIREIAESANPGLFNLHGINSKTQFIRTHVNERLDQIIQATIGFGTPARVRPATADPGSDVEEDMPTTGKSSRNPTAKRNFRNNLKALSYRIWSNSRDQLSFSSILCGSSPKKSIK